MILPYSADFPVPSEEEKEQLVKTGWIETSEGFVRYYPLVGASIIVDEEVATTTDEDGNFVVNGLVQGEHKISIEHNSVENGITKFEVISGETANVSLTTKVNFLTFMDGSEENSDNNEISTSMSITPFAEVTPYSGGKKGETLIPHDDHNDATYSAYAYVTCNRFNGKYGDQKYYKEEHHAIAAADNFITSDCDLAIGAGAPCLSLTNGDYATDASKRYCKSWAVYQNYSATCSQDIDHKSLYHKHTTTSGPTGY
ncbi:carboxypeptidase-like regulatory domain-containing protein [Paenibacillus thailandensis]|uniref:Carboxypeptidase-like regulatory domain-containing protein n=1 Tax=Paenibacillus thailandensis TaxID=393250 RepID=A0ABW5R3D3_9BACL